MNKCLFQVLPSIDFTTESEVRKQMVKIRKGLRQGENMRD